MKRKVILVVLALFVVALTLQTLPAQARNTLAKASGQGPELFDESISQPWSEPLNPLFTTAASKYDVPIELLLTLANFGSGFENRGSVPNIGGGYGVMGLTDNVVGGESLREASALTGIAYNTLILDPAASIEGAAALLASYAKTMKIDMRKGIGAWEKPVYKYAGLDDYSSQIFVYEAFCKLSAGMDIVNSSGERFAFSPMNLGSLDLTAIKPGNNSGNRARAMGGVSILSTEYGPAIWTAAASCNYSTVTNNKDTVVIHTAEGTASGTIAWFQDCAAQTSSHYVVAESGTVYQMVLEMQTAWHASCYNARGVGIEHEGYAASPSHPQALYDASALLTRHLCDRFSIQKTKTTVGPGIIGHVDVTNCCCGTHTDPGNGWDWNYYIAQVQGGTPTEIIIDNPQGVAVGTWATITNGADQYGSDFRYRSTSPTDTTNTFTWTPNISQAGSYQVYAWWSAGANRSSTAPYTIHHTGGDSVVPVNQTGSGGVFNLLGTYNFNAGTGGYIKLMANTTAGYIVVADAVKFTYVGGSAPSAPASAAVGTITTSSIVWNWGNVADETGFKLYDAATGGTQKGSTGVDVLTLQENTLAANTSYTRYICAYNGSGESSRTQLPVTVTLSVAPTTSTLTCDKPVSTPQTTTAFTFTAVGGFGAGTISSYKYVWDQTSTHTWTGSEATWNSGTNVCTATASGNWYLHVKGFNSASVENGTLDLGPYVYTPVPAAPASAAVGTVTTTFIVWNWGNVADETGFRLYDAATGGTQKGSTGVDVLTLQENSLVANTSYTRYICAYNANGESTRTQLPVTVTLSVAPTTSTVTCDKPVSTPQTTPVFTFTAVGGFGAGTISSYKYTWDQSTTHTWTGSEATWSNGTNACTATVNGNWYLHIKGYNSASVANGTLDMGPYVYNGTVPDIIVDNSAGVMVGTWTSSSGGYGTDGYRWRSTATGGTQTFTWTPNITVAGNYAVYGWWVASSNRSTVAPYTIHSSSGDSVVPMNQSINGSTFTYIGTYNFAVGTGGYIRLGCNAPSGKVVVADAVKLVKQ